jgi:hypothetical protein
LNGHKSSPGRPWKSIYAVIGPCKWKKPVYRGKIDFPPSIPLPVMTEEPFYIYRELFYWVYGKAIPVRTEIV